MELGLQGKVAIITGASKDTGKAIAEELAAEGAHVVLCVRSAAVLTEVAEALRQRTDVQALPVPADLSTFDGVHTIVRELLERFGKVDILINNTPAEIEAEWMRDNPLQRPGEPQEVAALAVFLASARASYITGALMQVDGGATRCI